MVVMAGTLFAPADSARAVAQVYSVSLVATAPLIVGLAAATLLRRAPAGTRALVWRAAMISLLSVCLGRWLPLHWMAWVVPDALATPLVALGRVQMALDQAALPQAPTPGAARIIRELAALYWAGVVIAVCPALLGWWRARRVVRSSRVPADPSWSILLDEVRAALHVSQRIELRITKGDGVPLTCGTLRPVVLLPARARHWSQIRRRTVLLHEVAHVASGDVAFSLAGRVVCALLWFHPGAWWAAARLRGECEMACDDRVLHAGVRPSDYARLLVETAAECGMPRWATPAARALVWHVGLRARLAAIVVPHDTRGPARAVLVLTACLTLTLATPLAAVRLAPTRQVLTALMHDARWESRAYAVTGLAQRSDTVAVARAAATSDPSPRVRAWAALALGTRRATPHP
jgi:beta-lactamase regulating signal transducer with metallopeptidase domain